MQKNTRIILGAAVLGAGLLMAASGHAKNAAASSKVVTAQVTNSGSMAADESCVAKHDSAIKKCGKNKKCVAKHKKLKNKCSTVYKPAERPHAMPQQMMPQQAAPARPMMQGEMGQRPMGAMQPEDSVLQRIDPQPTGKSTGAKTPDTTYMPPWLNF